MDTSAVLEYGAPEPGETASVMADKLRFHTDAWALSADLKAKHPAIVVIDARSHDAYVQAHIPGAVSLPHREMMRASTAASRPRQGLRCLLRWDWLQRLDKGDVQAHPAMSLPCGLVDGLPVGMMLVAKAFAEETIYRAAAAFERGVDWKSLRAG